MKNLRKGTGQKLWQEAKKIIPGGGQLISKRAERFLPEQWPAYYKKAKGVEVWDLDGRKYIDMSIMGIGCCILGYADRDVDRAVKSAIGRGTMNTLNCPEDVELAKLLLKLHPWAGMVRYARTGGEAMAIAVRIARVASGKDKVAFCGYHGWNDWYLAANLASKRNLDGHLIPGLDPAGVPRYLRGSAHPFHFNNAKELQSLLKRHKDIGVVVLEPYRHTAPSRGFLRDVERLTRKAGAVLVVDEITIAWRENIGGVHRRLGLKPDIAVFAKAMSNGYPMAAIVGKNSVMRYAENSFISSTYWTEAIGPVAALATIRKLRAKKVPAHLKKIGTLVTHELYRLAKKHGLSVRVEPPPSLISFQFEHGRDSLAIRTLYTQEMLRRGFLAGNLIYLSYAHKERHVRAWAKAADEVFAIIANAIREKNIHSLLKGPIAHSGFTRLT